MPPYTPVADLQRKRKKEKTIQQYTALPKVKQTTAFDTGLTGQGAKMIAARENRKAEAAARETQRKRQEQVFGAGLDREAADRKIGAEFGLQRMRGQQGMAQVGARGAQDMEKQRMIGQQGVARGPKVGSPVAAKAKGMSPKQIADVTARLRSQYYGKEFGKGLQKQYGEKDLVERGQSGFGLYLRDEMAKYQPAPTQQALPALTPQQTDIMVEQPAQQGVRSFTTRGTQAQSIPGVMPPVAAQPTQVIQQPTERLPALPERPVTQLQDPGYEPMDYMTPVSGSTMPGISRELPQVTQDILEGMRGTKESNAAKRKRERKRLQKTFVRSRPY